jgi:glycerol kinase
LTDPEHFGAEIPISAVVGDQQAALFGQLCLAPGQAKNTYGTGCFLLETTGSVVPAPPDGLLATIAWQRTAAFADSAPVDGAAALAYALEGSVFVLPPCPTAAASSSCLRSPVSGHRTGTPRRVAPSRV